MAPMHKADDRVFFAVRKTAAACELRSFFHRLNAIS